MNVSIHMPANLNTFFKVDCLVIKPFKQHNKMKIIILLFWFFPQQTACHVTGGKVNNITCCYSHIVVHWYCALLLISAASWDTYMELSHR